VRIATVAIYVENQDVAMRFWTEQVGFTVRRQQPMGPQAAWIEVSAPGAESALVIYPRAMMADWAERKPSVVFDCEDIHATHARLAARGVHFTQPPKDMPWGLFAIFLDPEGNWFGLRQRTVDARG
jgi:predicted enzyme related to lactoylglutathione lyase